MLTRMIAYSIGSIVAVLAVGTIFSSDLVRYADEQSVVMFGVILGALTAFLKPILNVLTVPISCPTFGLFALVLNAALFAVAARITPNVTVSIAGAVVGGIFAAIINGVIFSVAENS